MKARYYLLTTIVFTIFSTTSLLFAQDNAQDVSSINRAGTTAAQFLKIGAGARPIALGGAYTALANDIHSIYWNPAGLSRIVGGGEATFNHAEWLAETSYDFVAMSVNAGALGAIGLHVISFGTPEEPVRTVLQPDGNGQNWDASMIAAGLSYARNLTDRFSIGFTGKFVSETIFHLSARGAAFDLGILYDTPMKGLRLGAAMSNFGTKMKLDGRDLYFNESPVGDDGAVQEVPAQYRTESFDMPLNLRFGIAYQAIDNEELSVLVAVDGNQPNDNSEYINSGIELGVKDVIFLRGGYKALYLDDSEQGLTFGAGIRYDAAGTNLKFDFGWADYGRLNDVKFVSFVVRY